MRKLQIARGTTKNAYNVALSDWFNPPVIHRIKQRDRQIRVMASDNVMVTKVHVRILDEERNVLEEGEAEQRESGWWEYSSSMEGTIEVIAWDLAGNRTKSVL